MIKKIILGFLAGGSLVFLAGFVVTFQGRWLDSIVSQGIGWSLKSEVRCTHVKIRRWSEISFDSLTLYPSRPEKNLTAGPGKIRFRWRFPLLRANTGIAVELVRVEAAKDYLSRLPLLSAWVHEQPKKYFSIEALGVCVIRKKPLTTFHVYRFHSKEIGLKGGLRLKNGRIQKFHVNILLSGDLARKLPSDIRRRMIQRPDGWAGFKVTFQNQMLVVTGHSGPALKAQWQT